MSPTRMSPSSALPRAERALLFVAALGLFAAGAAQAQTTVWSATLTADRQNTYFGCDNGDSNQDNCSSSSVLTDDDFTYDGDDYTITRLTWRSDNLLTIALDGLTGAKIQSDLGDLVLNVDGTELAVSASTAQTGSVYWTYDPATNWAQGTQVAVSLVEPAKPKVALELGASAIAESGAGNSTTLKATLTPAVSSEVTVTVSAAPAGTVAFTATTLTISANATESGTVTVTAVDNDVEAPDATVTISGTVGSTDVDAPDDAMLTVSDDDGPKATLELGAAVIAESGAGNSTTLKATLSRAVSSAVTVTVSAAPADKVQFTATTLTIAASAVESGTVTVTAVDNNLAAPDATVTISGTVSGTEVDAPDDAMLTVSDDDAPGLRLAPPAVEVREGETATYTARLTVLPTGTVTVSVTSADSNAATVSSSSLTFTTSDWQTARTVTVEGVEDADLDHGSVVVTHAASGSSDYSSVSKTLTVTVEDDDLLDWGGNDRPWLVVDEGRSRELGVKLVSQPSSAVTVGVDAGDAALDVSPPALTFPAADWDTAQTLTFTAADDADAADFTRTVTFTGGGVTQSRDVLVHDDEATLAGNVAEGPLASPPLVVPRASRTQRGWQGFTTGPHGLGYTLRSVSLALLASDTGPFTDVTVTLVPATETGDPAADAAVSTLGTIAGAELAPDVRALHELRFPAVRLEAEKTYFVGISNQAAHSDDAAIFECAASGDETGMPGWSIADASVQDVGGTLASLACVLSLRLGGAEYSPPPPSFGGPPPPPADEEEEDGEEDDDGGGGGFTPPRAAIRTDAECADGLCRALTGVPVRFEDASTGSVQRRAWNFGEGSSRRAVVDWSWSAPGFYEVTLDVAGGEHESAESLVFLVEAASPAGTCVAGDGTRCLQDSRFSVDVEWWTAAGESGAGRVVRRGTNDSGLFSFFDRGNWEVLIKVLDGCALNGRVWVFGASTTDLGYVIRVTDTVTGEAREYRNEPGRPAPAITDAMAFPESCDER